MTQETKLRGLGLLTDADWRELRVGRERLHRLLIETTHADAWKNPKTAMNSWCFVNSKGTTNLEIEDLIDRYGQCRRFFGRTTATDFDCLLDWGFMTQVDADLTAFPEIGIFCTLGLTHAGSYSRHHNFIKIDAGWLNYLLETSTAENVIRELVTTLTHETVHYVLWKLFPESKNFDTAVSSQFDKITRTIQERINNTHTPIDIFMNSLDRLEWKLGELMAKLPTAFRWFGVYRAEIYGKLETIYLKAKSRRIEKDGRSELIKDIY
jgi:hypothetical protein